MKLIKPIDAFDPDDPLAPVENESRRAAQALKDYALMGSTRSIKALHKRYELMDAEWRKNKLGAVQAPPTTRWTTLSNYSVKFRWQERVHAYDEQIRRKEQETFESDRIRWREHRLRAAKNLLSKAIAGLNDLDVKDASLTQIARALQTAMNELRVEFGEEQRLTTSTDITVRVIREDKKPVGDDTDN